MPILTEFIELITLPRGPIERKPVWVGIIVILIVFVGPILWFYFKRKKTSKWEDGIWPADFAFNRDHLMEAYIGAAAILIRKDHERMHGKLPYINRYLQREFPNEFYDFKESYMHSLKFPVSIHSLADWLNYHIQSAEKEKLVRFLLSLTLSDGYLNEQELAAVMKFAAALQLDWALFEEEIPKATPKTAPSFSARERHLRTLGLETDASGEDIRSAYRGLVKMYHPDKFASDTTEAQQQATEQFRKIQEAYASLTE